MRYGFSGIGYTAVITVQLTIHQRNGDGETETTLLRFNLASSGPDIPIASSGGGAKRPPSPFGPWLT